MKKVLLFIMLTFLAIHANSQNYQELKTYLESNWETPEEYVISKFKNHDYVFIGEYHRIKHDVELILNLIPQLYNNGIYTLAIEFGKYEIQEFIDSITTAPVFDRNKLRTIYSQSYPEWCFKEYIDIYETAWQINNTNSTSSQRFRVVNIAPPYDPCKAGGAWQDFDPDVYMADVLFKEVIKNNQKALIYAGNHHAFTKYHQPYYDFAKDTLYGFTNTRMGNIIFNKLGEKTFNIYLHAGWISSNGWNAPLVLPVNGVIDSVMNMFNDKRVGFDMRNTPFGKLESTNSYYAIGYDNFTLERFCDGYIYQNSFEHYQPITKEKGFYNRRTTRELKKNLKCEGYPKIALWTLFHFNAGNRMYEDIRKHFKSLMKK